MEAVKTALVTLEFGEELVFNRHRAVAFGSSSGIITSVFDSFEDSDATCTVSQCNISAGFIKVQGREDIICVGEKNAKRKMSKWQGRCRDSKVVDGERIETKEHTWYTKQNIIQKCK